MFSGDAHIHMLLYFMFCFDVNSKSTNDIKQLIEVNASAKFPLQDLL